MIETLLKQDLFTLIISSLMALSVVTIFTAIGYNFLRAQRKGNVVKRTNSPVATFTMTLFFFGYFLLLQNETFQWHLTHDIQIVLTLIGTSLVVIGTIVNLLGRHVLGSNWADQVTVYNNQSLVQTGIYGIVRHPLYASLIWMFTGGALVYHNAGALLANLCIFLPAMHFRASQEEKLLKERFPEYVQYAQSVKRFFPSFRRGNS